MAEILPIRPWKYHPRLLRNIEDLAAPLFDVVSDNQRAALYENPYNSIHLSVPQPPEAATRAAALLDEWKMKGVLVQDPIPAIYVYYQRFRIAGDPKLYCRKGFICHIRTYDWKEKVILRHENTIPGAVNDRVELLEKTELHGSPTHGLYTDPTFELERYMDEAITNPIVEAEDYQGVRDSLAVIQDADIIRRFIEVINRKTIILADGHHRYEASLIYKRRMLKKFPAARHASFNFHLMYLTNTESDDLKILPTHRLIKGLPNFDPRIVFEKLKEDFIIKPVEDADTLHEIIAGKQWAFGIMMKDRSFKVRLKPEAFSKMTWPFPDVVKKLDLTVMHYFIIEKVLGIPGRFQRRSEYVSFDRSFSDCLKKVTSEEAQMAIITNEVSIEDVKAVCRSGYTMPQKSTYFYPKVIGGFLFTSIREAEFQEPVYSPFYYEVQ
ncbi:MAG TPA: DUF1015 domain-containing protein [Chryseosolibacter sp.]|nr:DUF1015 domain-containing protein [Chryseosolibacter sp.]